MLLGVQVIDFLFESSFSILCTSSESASLILYRNNYIFVAAFSEPKFSILSEESGLPGTLDLMERLNGGAGK